MGRIPGLHQDVSPSNILIFDKRTDDDDLGVMHDFDYSSVEPLGVNGGATQDLSDDDTLRLTRRTVGAMYMSVHLQLLTW